MTWYYSIDGVQHGPVTQDELASKIRSGEVQATSLIWRYGMTGWTAANQVAEFAGCQPSLTPASASPPALASAASKSSVPNYLWQSIVVTLFCCLPFGIVAIVFASKVDSLLATGQMAEAYDASRRARMWCWLSFGTSVGLISIYLLLYLFAAMAITLG